MRCLFFLLFEDYLEPQTQFARELDLEIERFARNMGDSGAVVRPFTGDIEKSLQVVLDKEWTEAEKGELYKTPSMLMIDVDFDDFNPRHHPWMLLHFGTKQHDGIPGAYHFRDVLAAIASAVNDYNVNPYVVAENVNSEDLSSEALKIFEAKPGICGFSIDLIQAGAFLRSVYRKHSGV